MTDTPPDVRAAVTALFMQRSEGERALMIADIRTQHPAITDPELRVQIFERTYGREFDEADRARIAQRIRSG